MSVTIDEVRGPSQTAQRSLLSKSELAEELNLSVRSIENLVTRRAIPRIKITSRIVRFSLPAVLAALKRFEVKEVR